MEKLASRIQLMKTEKANESLANTKTKLKPDKETKIEADELADALPEVEKNAIKL
jgi:hypothetical protein